jgi:hypothetical protein
MNDLSLVKTVDRLGESVVVAVSDAADGRLDAGFRQTLGVSNANVLRTSDALLFVKRRWGPD